MTLSGTFHNPSSSIRWENLSLNATGPHRQHPAGTHRGSSIQHWHSEHETRGTGHTWLLPTFDMVGGVWACMEKDENRHKWHVQMTLSQAFTGKKAVEDAEVKSSAKMSTSARRPSLTHCAPKLFLFLDRVSSRKITPKFSTKYPPHLAHYFVAEWVLSALISEENTNSGSEFFYVQCNTSYVASFHALLIVNTLMEIAKSCVCVRWKFWKRLL